MLLRRMSSRFLFLVPIWMPREKLIFADGLLRVPLTKADKMSNDFQLSKMREGWVPFLQGCPRFITRDHPSNLPIDLGKRGGPVKNTHECCYVQVEEDRKVDAIWHVSAALRPGKIIFVAFEESKLNLSLRDELSKFFIDGVGDCSVNSDYSLLSVRDSRMTSNKPSQKVLYVILDATISPKPFKYKDTFLVYILTQDEEKLMYLHRTSRNSVH
ncbi:uncharacterized protein [Triticum aestivum]|uniref:uncharacterized protein n=1 Tax=Triticum aestivum TaxID=4565 RepID=UPI001D012956|nr:uncharacterized protein LOC123048879 [Triticum aestivum]